MGIRKRDANSEDFLRLLARLDADPEMAWEKYDQLRLKLVAYFRSFGHSVEAEELADEALDRIAKKPDSYASNDLPILVLGFARNIRKEISKKAAKTVHPSAQDDLPDKDPAPEDSIIKALDGERRTKCFLRCMRNLMPNERWIVLKYYPDENRNLEELRRSLADALGIDGGTLAKRVARLRRKLEICCAKCRDEKKVI